MAHIFKPPVQRGIKEMQMSVLLYSCTCQYRANCSQKWENRNSDRPRHNDFQGLITAEHLTDISSSFKKRFSDEKLSLIRKRSLYMETFSEVSNILPKISICSGWLVIFTPKKKKKLDRFEGSVRSCAWQPVPFQWISERPNKQEYTENIYILQGFGIPFCLLLSTLSLTLWTPVLHLSISQ